MSTSVKSYAGRQTMIEAVRWAGGNAAYSLLFRWTHGRVKLRYIKGEPVIILEDGSHVEKGDYIAKVGGNFHKFTEADLQDIYVEVKD